MIRKNIDGNRVEKMSSASKAFAKVRVGDALREVYGFFLLEGYKLALNLGTGDSYKLYKPTLDCAGNLKAVPMSGPCEYNAVLGKITRTALTAVQDIKFCTVDSAIEFVVDAAVKRLAASKAAA